VKMESRTDAPTGSKLRLEFAYDHQDRRIWKKVTSLDTGGGVLSEQKFLYDGWNLVAEVGTSGSLVRSHVWGTDLSGSLQGAGGIGGLLEVSCYGSTTTNCFPAFDGNGNVAALINGADGTVAANYDYTAFGEPIRVTGVMARNNPFRFSTKYDDDESDLLYYGYRYYKPSTGTWPHRDPAEEDGGLNLYEITENDTLDIVDVLGEQSDGNPPDSKVCLCTCKKLTVTPDQKNPNVGYYDFTDLLSGDIVTRFGFPISWAWTVDGDPAKCTYHIHEPKGGVTGSGPNGKFKPSAGTDQDTTQSGTDPMGLPVTGPGKYKIKINLTQTYTCTSDDGTKMTVTVHFKAKATSTYGSE